MVKQVIWYLVLLVNFQTYAQMTFTGFESFTVEDGFPSVAVHSMLRDSRGFMWFGTAEALVSYDGVEYKVYPVDNNDSTQLQEGNIHYLFEDSKGRIWLSAGIGYQYPRTIQVFDPKTEQFYNTKVKPLQNSWYQNQNKAQGYMLEDDTGNIWIKSMRSGIYKIEENDRNQFTTTNYRVSQQFSESLSGDSVSVLFIDSRKIFWVGTKDGLYNFDPIPGEFKKYHGIDDKEDQVTGIVEDLNNKLWVNYDNQGLYLIDPINKTVESKWTESNRALWYFNARFMLQDNAENIWMMKNDYEIITSLDRYNTRSGEVTRYFKDFGYLYPEIDKSGNIWVIAFKLDNTRGVVCNLYLYNPRLDLFEIPSDMENESTWMLYADQFDNLWISIWGQGAYRYRRSDQKAKLISQLGVQLYHNEVYQRGSMFEDGNGNFWIPRIENGINKYNINRNLVVTDQSILAKDLSCQYLYQDSQGNVWALFRAMQGPSGEMGRFVELYRIDTSDNSIKHIKLPVGISEVRSFVELNEEEIMFSLLLNGLYTYNHTTKEFNQYYNDPEDSTTVSSDAWALIVKNNNDSTLIWSLMGIDHFDATTGQFSNIVSNHLPRFGKIHDVFHHVDATYWIAGTYGLILYNIKKDEFEKSFLHTDGYPTKDIVQIIRDHNNNLWLLTRQGLVLFDPQAESFKKFDKGDGVLGNPATGFIRSNGQIVFGGDKGIFVIEPDNIPYNETVPKPVVTRLLIDNNTIPIDGTVLSKNISFTDHLTLSFNQNVISFAYAALSLANASKNQYAYYMDGVDKDWKYVGNQTYAGYAGLQPGEYTFNLKASNNDGLWNEEPTQLKITILPPWWETWWAYAIYAILFFGSMYAYYRFQVNRKLELAETKRLRELDEFKTRFYTNITHEFRTPLTVILGVSDQIDLQFLKIRNLIKRNALNVLQLVNQLLDLSKLESGMLRLNTQQGDFGKFIKYVAESFHSLAEIKNIDIHFRSEVPELVMDFDTDKVMNVLSNLLSNAIKFTPEMGHISIIMSKQQQGEQATMILKVSDTGVGIAEDQLENIFDRFYQVDSSMTRKGSGTGIGLALTRELVRLMSGEIRVKSTLYQGTEFTIELPITNQAEYMDKITPAELAQVPDEDKENVIAATHERSDRPVALIVEDSIDVVYYLKTCLQQDYSLRIANNGQEGIEKALESSPDIIISDVMMPEKNGYELTDTLKNDVKTSHIPIILLTAKASEEDKLAGLGVGADAYLTKPFNVDELKLRIRNLIRERKKLWSHYNESLSYEPQTLKVSSPDQKFLTQAMEILEEYKSDSEFNSAKLQQELGVSRTLLHVKLKALAGQSTTEFIRTYRLKYAATLILQDFGNIAEIAYESGFNDQSYFTKSFRKHFGVAASEYKDSNQH